jgi:hypothetical protein
MYLQRGLLVLAAASALAIAGVAGGKSDSGHCGKLVSKENAEAGVGATYDVVCLDNPSGVGCFDTACRFCRATATATEQSKFFESCADQHAKTAKYEDTAICAVAQGDRDAGISSYYDESCPFGYGGLGCQQNKCRFCKTRATPASQGFLDCPSSSGNAAPAPPTSPVSSATTPASPAIGSDCASAVAASGLSAVSFVAETRCNTASPKLVGCVAQTSCQLCRSGKTEGNQYLVSCRVLRELRKTESVSAFSSPDTFFGKFASDHEPEEKGGDVTATIAAVGGATIAVVLAVVAIFKAKQKKAKNLKRCSAPCTPLDGSLMSLETCVSNL